MTFGNVASAEAAAQSAATAQAMLGQGSAAELDQVALASFNIAVANQLVRQGATAAALALLAPPTPTITALFPIPGLPFFGLLPATPSAATTSPTSAFYDTQYANQIISAFNQLTGINAAQAALTLGSNAMLANSSRRFLLSTYFGL